MTFPAIQCNSSTKRARGLEAELNGYCIRYTLTVYSNKYKREIVEWSRDGSAKKYMNKMVKQGWQVRVDIPSYIYFK